MKGLLLLWLSVPTLLLADEPAYITLERQSAFDMRSIFPNSDMLPGDVCVRSGKLYVQFQNRLGDAVVAILSTSGKIEKSVIVPVTNLRIWLGVDDAGNLYVRHKDVDGKGSLEQVVKFDQEGHKLYATEIVRPGFIRAVVVGTRFIGFSPTDASVYAEDGQLERTIPIKDREAYNALTIEEKMVQNHIVVTPIDSHRVTAIHSSYLKADTIDVVAGNRQASEFVTASLKKKVTETNPIDIQHISFVVAADSGRDGNLYLLLGSYSFATGARILEVTPEGEELKAMYCPLATFPQYKSAVNPEGYMTPQEMRTDGQDLVIYNVRGGVVSCRLPVSK